MGLDEFLHKTWNHRWKIMKVWARNKWESFFFSQLFCSRYWDLQFILNSIEFLVNTADSGYFLLALCFSTDCDRNLQRQTLQFITIPVKHWVITQEQISFKFNLFFWDAFLTPNVNNNWHKSSDCDCCTPLTRIKRGERGSLEYNWVPTLLCSVWWRRRCLCWPESRCWEEEGRPVTDYVL